MHPRIVLTIVSAAMLLTVSGFGQSPAADDILLADFEGDTYGEWKAEGEAFGSRPAEGTLPGQMHVSGYKGKGLVNSFYKGDKATGRLTSPLFKIERPYINFLVGGGAHEGNTCIDLLIGDKTVRTATGLNDRPGGSETLSAASWDVTELAGKQAVIRIVDQHSGGWGHINVDHIVQSSTMAAKPLKLVTLEKTLDVDNTHLIVPVANSGRNSNSLRFGLYDGETMIQNFNVSLPRADDAYWLAAYPLKNFRFNGKRMTIKSDRRVPDSCQDAFQLIKVAAATDALKSSDYLQPYRNQFHAAARRGWNNDPNGMVYHDGKYHLYFQHNPFGIFWGNMHWGHLESTDLIHWTEQPIALYQKTVGDMAFSGGGFVDFNNSAGLGENTLFVAFTSTGRGECLAYSKDGGRTFTELNENPVVKHNGRDPKIIWYQPEKKWVMAIYDNTDCEQTKATPVAKGSENLSAANLAFWESKNLRQWTRAGAFTDPDRHAVFECPEIFELPIQGQTDQTRWIVYGAQNRYFVGRFDGKTFHKQSGPHGSRHGAFYAAQTFSDIPDGRRIQIGWVRTASYQQRFPDQIVNQALTLPHEMTLRETSEGLRVFFWPVAETEKLRGEVLAEGKDLTAAAASEMLQACRGKLTEVLIEFVSDGSQDLLINGIDAKFDGRAARIFTDRTFNEVYADDGAFYEVRTRSPQTFASQETGVSGDEGTNVKSLKIYELRSIWPK